MRANKDALIALLTIVGLTHGGILPLGLVLEPTSTSKHDTAKHIILEKRGDGHTVAL
jgi:hypothetical protein